ncbi:MAG TPA: NUDIX hydrolase [Candidatus Saccharibacteria bacterium]|nr:NUDIX hydrolase [Candidatus Saccharibacteria bacterium]HMT39511.1 NUDIX hydrolase [Candidatus Saccharibacteria bacterium]
MKIDSRLTHISDCLYRVSVKALIFDNPKVLLVKEWDDEWWSFPGGGIEYGESIQEALYREIEEELGISHKNIKSGLNIIHTGIGVVVEKLPMANLFVWVHIPVRDIKPTRDVVEYKWFTYDELKELKIVPTTTDIEHLFSVIKKLII